MKTLRDLTNYVHSDDEEDLDNPLKSVKELRKTAIEWVRDDKRRISQGNINVDILLRRWMIRLGLTDEEIQKEAKG